MPAKLYSLINYPLSLVASKTNNSVIITDSQYCVEWVNEGFLKMFGLKRSKVLGEKITELITVVDVDDETMENRMLALSKGEPVKFQAQFLKKGGNTFWLSSEVTPLLDKSGVIYGYLEVQTDITPLKLSEINLSKLADDLYRQNNDLQQFTYIVSHNLRAPVANVLGLSQILTREGKEYERFEASLENLTFSASKLDDVLKDMNTILSIRDGKGNLELGQVNITLVLEQAVTSMKEQIASCNAEVNISIEADLSVRANRAYLYSIFINLFSNAFKYRDSNRQLIIRIKSENSYIGIITLTFSDNGSGFDTQQAGENLFKLYKRFHRKGEGKGIGLYLIKAHMEAMGGRVAVESQVGKGTYFTLHFLSDDMLSLPH